MNSLGNLIEHPIDHRIEPSREPRNIEALILSMADRMSGQGDLYAQLAPGKSSYGKYHRYIGGKPFFLVSEVRVR